MTEQTQQTIARLDEIEARERKATQGPWNSRINRDYQEIRSSTASKVIIKWTGFDSADVSKTARRANCRFIAHARTDVPDLVAALRDALAELDRLKEIDK